MLLQKIRYFQRVVQYNSFTKAAEECHISQSAISQQVKSLEQELNVQLITKSGRRFSLTPAGKFFYGHLDSLITQFDRLCFLTQQVEKNENPTLRIGYLREMNITPIIKTLTELSKQYPNVDVKIMSGNHDELYTQLKEEKLDIIINDQRRALSSKYINFKLLEEDLHIRTSYNSELAQKDEVETSCLKESYCISTVSDPYRESERDYIYNDLGIPCQFKYVSNEEEMKLMVAANKGFMLSMGNGIGSNESEFCEIKLLNHQQPLHKKYYAFWKKGNSGYYIEELASRLKSNFYNL